MAREIMFSEPGARVQVSHDIMAGFYRLRVRGTALLLTPLEAALARDELMKVSDLPRGETAPG